MAKFQLPTSTKGGSKGFAPPRKTATKTAPRPKARPLAPARFESKPPPPPPTDPVGAWACLYAKKGPKKKITWLDGEVVREPYPGNMHRVKLIDADTKAQVTSTTKPASLAPFEVDKDDEWKTHADDVPAIAEAHLRKSEFEKPRKRRCCGCCCGERRATSAPSPWRSSLR